MEKEVRVYSLKNREYLLSTYFYRDTPYYSIMNLLKERVKKEGIFAEVIKDGEHECYLDHLGNQLTELEIKQKALEAFIK